ncbi:MAG: polysaccharide biosynthesis/export family protein [Candidatus Delongbacteria bacterium]
MLTRRIALSLALILVGLGLSSCAIKSRKTLEAAAPQPQESEALAPGPLAEVSLDQPYLIRFGDQLSLQVAGQDDSRLMVVVRPDGRVSLPYLGEVDVAGKTIPFLQQEAERAFAHQFRDPLVFVNVAQMAPHRLYVFGEVNKPGMVESESTLNVIQLLAMAGGPTAGAELRSLVVIDEMGDGHKRIRLLDITSEDPNELLKISMEQIDSFDIVIVPRRLITEVGQFVRDYVNVFLPPIDTYLRGRYYWTIEGNN